MPSQFLISAQGHPLTGIAIGSVGPAENAALGGSSNGIAQQFTPSSNKHVQQVKITFHSAPAAGTYRVGITTPGLQVGAAPPGSGNVWVGGSTNYVDVVNPGAGDLLVTLPVVADLISGTPYYIVLYALTSGSVSTVGFNFTAAVAVGGSSSATIYGTDWNANTTILEFPFTLYGF